MNTKKVNVQMLEPQPTNGTRTIDTTSSQTIAKPIVSGSPSRMTNLELITQHTNDTGFCSVMAHAKSVSSTYNEIVSKGMSIVPDILRYLKNNNEGMHIIMLLMAIVEEKPFPYLPKIHGHWNVKEAREAWIEWGQKTQLI